MSLAEKRSTIYTVSRLNRFAKQILSSEIGDIWLSGEISNFTSAASGHWYFTLKDDKAQIKAAMFRNANRYTRLSPKMGDKVLVRGNVSLYEARGDYQLIVEHMEPEGTGRLKQAFDALKLKLANEGLFAQEHKKAIPSHPKRIGIVTSASGAALHDILSVLARRNPQIEVILYPSQVQGDAAAAQLRQALGGAVKRNEVDLLLLTRGGGSLEDLWCFNDEGLVRDLFSCPLPVVSAVGHEIDFTLCDFVADLRAPTPSAAAELVSYDQQEHTKRIQQSLQRLKLSMHRRLLISAERLANTKSKLELVHPTQKIQQQYQMLDQAELRLHNLMQQKLDSAKSQLLLRQHRLAMRSPKGRIDELDYLLSLLQKRLHTGMAGYLQQQNSAFAKQCELLHALSPLATLSRGYSITYSGNRIISDAKQVNAGDILETRLQKGVVISKVQPCEPT